MRERERERERGGGGGGGGGEVKKVQAQLKFSDLGGISAICCIP